MVSLRRRRLLGLCSGNGSFVTPLPLYCENLPGYETLSQQANPKSEQSVVSDIASVPDSVGTQALQVNDLKGTNSSVTPVPLYRENLPGYENSNQQANPKSEQSVVLDIASPVDSVGTQALLNSQNTIVKDESGSSNGAGSSPSKEQPIEQNIGPPVKRRKRHSRKVRDNQEPCLMRGVYFKNMKWQAAIKVDKKQIHLGTVATQEEAAHLYDRAAFMCGREPNFELPAEEKLELSKLKWEEFLTVTRQAIAFKKQKKGTGAGSHIKVSGEPSLHRGDSDSMQVVSDDVEHETAVSKNLKL